MSKKDRKKATPEAVAPTAATARKARNKAYEAETEELHHDAKAAAQAPTTTRLAVVVLVDNLDAATARAVQYARTLGADDQCAVHFDLDAWKTDMLIEAWRDLGLARFPLDIVECPDRRWNSHALACSRVVVVSYDTRTSAPNAASSSSARRATGDSVPTSAMSWASGEMMLSMYCEAA